MSRLAQGLALWETGRDCGNHAKRPASDSQQTLVGKELSLEFENLAPRPPKIARWWKTTPSPGPISSFLPRGSFSVLAPESSLSAEVFHVEHPPPKPILGPAFPLHTRTLALTQPRVVPRGTTSVTETATTTCHSAMGLTHRFREKPLVTCPHRHQSDKTRWYCSFLSRTRLTVGE